MLITSRTTSPDGSKSPCLECIRSGEECILAGSRRGGDFSKFRRSARKQRLNSVSTPNHDDANELEFQQNSECEKGSEDPIYAELTNPGDALQILARLAASDPKRYNEDTNPRARNSPDSDSCKDEVNSGENSIKRIQTPALQRPLSETETLVIGILGTDTARSLLNQ
ncbi:hypothetical protein N7481_005398 [Penicillium waksmanii]|uniref:uncharacterized protein n=1 Tax=Penicillium waksmanii TaxID=69791 RepID=UPI0025489855|nr:uncharacterized protein N7481_005398 [Penicillium waksmanii]KAJ5983299.1 hypothetical protein N7481_005398 [Penicillium waksmanii]